MYRRLGLDFLVMFGVLIMLSACNNDSNPAPAPVVTLQSISVTPQAIGVALDAGVQLTATGTYSDSTTRNLNNLVIWSSGNTAVATVGANTGWVTPVAGAQAGQTVVITATSGTLTASATVTLKALQSIAVTPINPSIAANKSVQLTATGTYSDGSTQNITSLSIWSSSNTAVATVGANTGLITTASAAIAGQTAIITVTSGSLNATTTVTIAASAGTLQSIAVTPLNPNVALNGTVQLTATGTYSDATTKDITNTVTWSSGSPTVATVGASTGLVSSAAGATTGQTAIITATSGAVTATVTVTITTATLPTFDIAAVSDPLVLQQWGLRNTAQTGYADNVGVANTSGTLGTDINVNPVYTTYGYVGKGIIVAVVDSGLEIVHEDLGANVVPSGSWNFINNTTDPTNTVTTGDHGTEVSGLIAMAKNGKGGIGVASSAQLKGFNYLSSSQLLSYYIASLGGSSASPNSTDVAIFNQSFGTSNTSDFLMNSTVEAQYASGTSTLRGGKGALYVKSAGNGFISFGTADCTAAVSLGVSCQNANFDPGNTLPYQIVMAALNAKGKKSSYSTAGSAIWVSTPGGEYGYNASVSPGLVTKAYDPALITTDQSGCTSGASVTGATTSVFSQGGTNLSSINLNCNYTNNMNGTSSAAPMMSGVIALMLEANSALTWREVKDILARTAVQVDSTIAAVSLTLGNGISYVAEQGWITNAAGRKFHNWYGFGAVNASAAVTMAKTYTSGSMGTFADTGWISSGTLSSAIADNSTVGASASLTVPAVGTSGIVETVQIKVTTIDTGSGFTGDLGIELTSPSGTKSILKTIKDGFASTNLAGMVLASNAFYGESSLGTWTVKVVDGWSGGTQTLSNVQIRIYGH